MNRTPPCLSHGTLKIRETFSTRLEHLEAVLSMWPCQNLFPHPSFSYLLFSNSTHKTKTGIPNRWETTNSSNPSGLITYYLANQKQGTINKYDLTLFISLFQGPRRRVFQGHKSVPVNPLHMTAAPHPGFPVKVHILSAGDALSPMAQEPWAELCSSLIPEYCSLQKVLQL